jgi:hypothetical protein
MSFQAWIKMDDERPPQNVPVLVRAHDGTITAASWESGENWEWWNGAGFGGYEWEWDWLDREPWRGVTHWMPLPLGPETEAAA